FHLPVELADAQGVQQVAAADQDRVGLVDDLGHGPGEVGGFEQVVGDEQVVAAGQLLAVDLEEQFVPEVAPAEVADECDLLHVGVPFMEWAPAESHPGPGPGTTGPAEAQVRGGVTGRRGPRTGRRCGAGSRWRPAVRQGPRARAWSGTSCGRTPRSGGRRTGPAGRVGAAPRPGPAPAAASCGSRPGPRCWSPRPRVRRSRSGGRRW